MSFYPDERLALFIDGANLYSTTKALDLDIDYRKMLDLFKGKGRLVSAKYYTAVFEHDDYSKIQPLIDWLDYNGYQVVTKPAKEYTDRDGRRKIKGNMDIEIAVDILELADHVDHILLMSGDGDFRYLLQAVQRKGVRVTVISTSYSKPPMLSDDLKRQADTVLDLVDLERTIGRSSQDDA